MFRHVQKREHITLFSPCNFFPLFLLSFSGKVKCKISVDSSTLHSNSLKRFMFSLVHKYFPIAKNGVYFYTDILYCTVYIPHPTVGISKSNWLAANLQKLNFLVMLSR